MQARTTKLNIKPARNILKDDNLSLHILIIGCSGWCAKKLDGTQWRRPGKSENCFSSGTACLATRNQCSLVVPQNANVWLNPSDIGAVQATGAGRCLDVPT